MRMPNERVCLLGICRFDLFSMLRCSSRNFHLPCRSLSRNLSSSRNAVFKSIERAEDEVDVCIVGGGPAGLSAAIRLKQLEREKGNDLRVVVLEKGSEVGMLSVQFVPSARWIHIVLARL